MPGSASQECGLERGSVKMKYYCICKGALVKPFRAISYLGVQEEVEKYSFPF